MATTIGVAGLIGKGIIDYNQLREKEKFLKKERELKSNELTEMTNRYEADKNNLLEQNLAKNKINLLKRGLNLTQKSNDLMTNNIKNEINHDLIDYKTRMGIKQNFLNNKYDFNLEHNLLSRNKSTLNYLTNINGF